jgi:protoporphyrinogen/coproporphyrinogen III oxidase
MKTVAIVGGGVAGLTCAFALKERNVDAIVFEGLPRAGGRCSAATYLLGPDVYPSTFRMIKSLGLDQEVIGIPPIAGQFYKGRVYHHRVGSVTGLLGFKGLNVADKAMLSRMAYLLMRHHAKLDFHHPERGESLDDETVAAFVKRELSQNILNYIAGPLISTLFFYGSQETSKLLYLNLVKYMYNTTMFTIRGGLQRMTDRLAERVTIETSGPVESIARDGTGFTIQGRYFPEVVIAVPGSEVLRIRGVEALLDKEDQEFFRNCRYGRAIAVSLETPAPIESCYALSIPRVEGFRAATIIFHHFIDRTPRVSIIGGGEAVTTDQLVEDFCRIYPDVQAARHSRDWAAAMPKFPPGRFRELSRFQSRQRGPGLFFCGDYLMGPFLEAAVSTGLRAAEGVLSRSL